MKKILALISLAALIISIQACGGSDSPKQAIADYLDIMDSYITSMEKAKSADDVARAINTCADNMDSLAPRLKAVFAAHPEWKDMKGSSVPADLKEFEERIKSFGPKMMGMMGKMIQFMKDPKVQKANQRFQESMQILK